MNDLASYEFDIPGFARDVLGVTKGVHPGQARFLNLLAKRRSRWVARYMTIMLASGNRGGKTAALAIFYIHSCLFKTNLMSVWPEGMSDKRRQERWVKAEYHAYHFGISHEVADLVYNEIVRLLDGAHRAQEDGCPLTASGPVESHDVKEYGDYHWVKFNNGAELHFRTTGEKALGTLGKDMHLIGFDEAGLEQNLDFLVEEVFDFRRLGTGGQLIMVSTPSEDLGTTFADRWELGNHGQPANPRARGADYQEPTLANVDAKASHISMRMSSVDNIGYGLTQEMFDILTEGMDDRRWNQNVEGIFIQAKSAYFHAQNVSACFKRELPERTPARKSIAYIQGVDPAKQKDSAWSIVLAVIPDPEDPSNPYLVGVRAEQKRGQKSTETIVALAADAFNAYEVVRLGSRCYTAIDATGFGGKMFRERLDEEIPSVHNVEFGGTVQKKRKLLGDLRTVIDSGRLILPAEGIWLQVRKQLLGYKLEDRGIEQDAVMALVCAVWLIRRAPADGKGSVPFDLSGAA